MKASLRVLYGARGLGLVPRSARTIFLLVRGGVVMLSAFCPRARGLPDSELIRAAAERVMGGGAGE